MVTISEKQLRNIVKELNRANEQSHAQRLSIAAQQLGFKNYEAFTASQGEVSSIVNMASGISSSIFLPYLLFNAVDVVCVYKNGAEVESNVFTLQSTDGLAWAVGLIAGVSQVYPDASDYFHEVVGAEFALENKRDLNETDFYDMATLSMHQFKLEDAGKNTVKVIGTALGLNEMRFYNGRTELRLNKQNLAFLAKATKVQEKLIRQLKDTQPSEVISVKLSEAEMGVLNDFTHPFKGQKLTLAEVNRVLNDIRDECIEFQS